MPTIILNHRVTDYAAWKTQFDNDKLRRDQSGAREIAVGQKAGDSGNVYIIMEIDTMENLNQMMADPELQQKMQEGGVIGAPEMIILE